MKKFLLFVVAIVAVVLVALAVLGSCGSSNSPKGVAKQSMECLKNKDFKGYTDLMYFSKKDLETPEKVQSEKESYQELLQKAFAQRTEDKGDIKDYNVVEQLVEDSAAVVKMAVVSTTDKKDTIDIKLRKDDHGDWKIDTKK
ncbi:MAG: DUF4878 domain-containing protein [Prevotella sp.]|nr:DUF4878 domain-containing protein [Prevotella sp.]